MPAVVSLGVSSFRGSTFGHYLRSHEDASTMSPKCVGWARPVFEMKPVVAQGDRAAYVLQPGAPPGGSAL
eukprot:652908-Lingulodinium_polyedra.AAC.1